jgi:meso-butanediol dehydrogenase / (S,S)-butanediol dehydrogenase / diacetyl reductase
MTPPAHDSVALETGAASGIGRAAALRLAADGWRLVLIDRDRDRLADTADAVSANLVAQLACDLTEAAAVDEVVGAVVAEVPIGLLVNNAGSVSAPRRPRPPTSSGTSRSPST